MNVAKSNILEDLALVEMAEISSLDITDSASARVSIQDLASVTGDITIERHELTGPQRSFDLDLEGSVIGGNVIIADVSGT